MSGKKFTFNVNKNTIEKDGEFFCYLNSYNTTIIDKLNEQEERIHDKEELIRAKNQQLDDVKQILTYHKKVISYREVGKCTNARLELILQILYELGWD